MKSTEGYHIETIQCQCPYCNNSLIFEEHPHCYEPEPKSKKEVCYKCGKTFWLKAEQ